MKWPYYILLIVSVTCTGNMSFSQEHRTLSDTLASRMDRYAASEETSVYLAGNKDIYIAGEDLWFNAFVLDRALGLTALDKILYLQLTKADSDTVIWQEMYPVYDGIAAGHVYLPQTLQEGQYLLKAYTPRSYCSLQPYFYAVASVQVVQDPRSVKRNLQPIQAVSPRPGEKMQIDIFPEGGVLVAGIQHTIAFSAKNSQGQPALLKAELFKNGSPLTAITTTHAGMGLFRITPEVNATYTIRYEGNDFKLPPVSTDAVALQLQKMSTIH